MAQIKFKIAAKTNVGVVRKNNEDNFQAASDLSNASMTWVNDQECTLTDKGALLVVADGMGGMNAGEVASDVAIQTVKKCFSPEHLTDDLIGNQNAVEKFLKAAIVKADAAIKEESKKNPESHNMGTTIVIGWLLENKLYVAWCGDSRAYVFNTQKGLFQLSKDHSYVQELVDAGKLSQDDAFDFPDSNIITRCLSDASTKAKPETLPSPYVVEDGDVIMLCTDGLSGLIRDYEIESIMRENEDNMETCINALIDGACNAGGHDNITVALCKIISGAPKKVREVKRYMTAGLDETTASADSKSTLRKAIIIPVICFLIGVFVGGFGYRCLFNGSPSDTIVQSTDSIQETNTTNLDDSSSVNIEEANPNVISYTDSIEIEDKPNLNAAENG